MNLSYLRRLGLALALVASVLACGPGAPRAASQHDHGEPDHGEHDHAEHGHDDHSRDDHSRDEHSHDDHSRDEHSRDEHSHERGAAGHDHDDGGHTHGEGDSWAVTAFGDRYEIFAEADPLTAGGTARSHTHVTVLDGFTALETGRVAAVLVGSDGGRQVFAQERASRPGIFDVALTPRSSGDFALSFEVDGPAGHETIPAGSVRVGTAGHGGGLEVAVFAPDADPEGSSFLKEQQWRTTFATAWTARGALAESVRGAATVRPAAGGEVVLTAPFAGVVRAAGAWPHPGRDLAAGERLMVVVPRRTDAVTPAALEAEITALEARLGVGRDRLERLRRLLAVEAASQREVEALDAELAGVAATLDARRRELASELAARRGGAAAGAVAVSAPFAGAVAEIVVSPGEAVEAGAALGRVLRRAPLWVEVQLPPAAVAAIGDAPAGLLLQLPGAAAPLVFGAGAATLVSRRPEVDAASGTVGVILAVADPPPALLPGLHASAEVLCAARREGIVIPRGAVVDDDGVDVVYVQLDGESFARREVHVEVRQGDHVLVSGLAVGERLVTRGGAAIRRAGLVSTGGAGHGHVH